MGNLHPLLVEILKARGLADDKTRAAFLSPDYVHVKHDPYLLPGMEEAVQRLMIAQKQTERVVIYGDYDIDGLTATSVLLDAFRSFGL